MNDRETVVMTSITGRGRESVIPAGVNVLPGPVTARTDRTFLMVSCIRPDDSSSASIPYRNRIRRATFQARGTRARTQGLMEEFHTAAGMGFLRYRTSYPCLFPHIGQ